MSAENEKIYQAVARIVNLFPKGKEKYLKSSLFNRCVQMLARGMDSYEIIDMLIDITETTNASFEHHLKYGTFEIKEDNQKSKP